MMSQRRAGVMPGLYPETEPYEHGMLEVGYGNIVWLLPSGGHVV